MSSDDGYDEFDATHSAAQKKRLVRVFVKKAGQRGRVVEYFEPGPVSQLIEAGYFVQVGPGMPCGGGDELALLRAGEERMAVVIRRNKNGELVNVSDENVAAIREHLER